MSIPAAHSPMSTETAWIRAPAAGNSSATSVPALLCLPTTCCAVSACLRSTSVQDPRRPPLTNTAAVARSTPSTVMAAADSSR
jgi:hypothetical protein